MKFAKELEDDLVPEWRAKYLDYKGGKKRIKAISRAFRNANNTPKSLGGQKPLPPGQSMALQSNALPYTQYDFNQRGKKSKRGDLTQNLFENGTDKGDQTSRPGAFRARSVTFFSKSPPNCLPEDQPASPEPTPERQPLNIPGGGRFENRRQYGSIVGTPPYPDPPPRMDTLLLPDSAMSLSTRDRRDPPTPELESFDPRVPERSQHPVESPDAYHVGPNHPHMQTSSLPGQVFRNRRAASYHHAPKNSFPRSKLRRIFSSRPVDSPADDVRLDEYRELDAKQEEFFNFLDKELDKIENFYREKEDEASERLQVLRGQLHELRDRRMEDIIAAKKGKEVRDENVLNGLAPVAPAGHGKDEGIVNGSVPRFLKPIEDALLRKPAHIGKTSKAMENLGSPTGADARKRKEDKSDYTRRVNANERVPYRFAKRRLKLALQEFYRALELLKSYALLNRTGFRKVNKKYDKAVNARPTLRYMSEKVNHAHFVQSNIIEGHIVAVEDLYARYFERGNHKIAVGKLRTKLRAGDQSSTSFRNGLFVAAGIIAAMQGLIGATQHLQSNNPTLKVQASYLLQLYAGYFLIDLLFILFVLNCKVWTAAKINYVFVFEYDTRHVLDWRQLAELPCFFMFLNGLFLWLNFRQNANGNVVDSFYLYYPLVLIVVTLLIMCIPLPIFYHNARKWWGFSNWRLLLAGVYPVEFRDFYLGDMYCSETYAMSQVELFFCLYINEWQDPPRCNSNHSRLLGFFTTLPAIWRAFQCLRRYYDSRNWFPHLANFSKYCCNILYYMSLSLYRINKTNQLRGLFIFFGAINAIYCSFWDVAMDFSLGNPWAKHPFLRDHLGYRKVWVYYVAAISDVILRQQWIFYAIFAHDLQHSAFLSFAIGLAEVLRRGMWSLFRVENEHCNNVGQFRASRDIPLPYSLPCAEEQSTPSGSLKAAEGSKGKGSPLKRDQGMCSPDTATTGVDLEWNTIEGTSGSSLRLRKPRGDQPANVSTTPGIRALQRVGTVIAKAHAQDFTKKKLPAAMGTSPASTGLHHGGNDSTDDSEEVDSEIERQNLHREGEQMGESEEEVMEAQKVISRGQG